MPVVTTNLTFADTLGRWRVRWNIRRDYYRVRPGLYAVGSPTPESPVFVSANYKLSFDLLRESLGGCDGWILVLETYGINVWCAAGKGTFGTLELARRVLETRLGEIVSHKKLIVPQLGATGVSAYRVKFYCGFNVVFGPVRVQDLPAFLEAGMKADQAMRRVHFGLLDRLVMIPVEMAIAAKYFLLAMIVFAALSGLHRGGYDLGRLLTIGLFSFGMLVVAWLAGSVLSTVLLPWLPGRAFALKGFWAGLIAVVAVGLYVYSVGSWPLNWTTAAAWLLIVTAVASFTTMNFTGASTFTSLSGVRKEILYSVPLQAGAAIIGAGLWIAGRYI